LIKPLSGYAAHLSPWKGEKERDYLPNCRMKRKESEEITHTKLYPFIQKASPFGDASYITKEPLKIALQRLFSHFSFVSNYIRAALSVAAESLATLSFKVLSTLVVSAPVLEAVFLSPQDAKEIAAIATNIKTNFFIFFAF